LRDQQDTYYTETDEMKKDYQEKIDELFKESYDQAQKVTQIDNENESLKQDLWKITEQIQSVTEQVHTILKENDINFTDDERLDSKIHLLATILTDKQQLLNKITCQNEEKAEEIEQLTVRNKLLIEESKKKEAEIKNKLDRSKEENSIKTLQIEATEKILKESRDLFGKKKEMNDHNTKSLQRLLSKLEQKQSERSIERSCYDKLKSRISPMR